VKTLKRFLIFIGGVGLLIACSKSDDFWWDEQWRKFRPMVTITFKADYIGNYTFMGEDLAKCGKGNLRVIVDGQGTSTFFDAQGRCDFLENSSIHFDLCSYPEGYGPTVSQIVADNGDILYVSCQGNIIEGKLDDHPSFVTSYWKDPFVILGGTGRFEGATGGGMTDDYNSRIDINSHHHWKGTITLAK